MGDAWSHDCPEKMGQFCLFEDEQVWGEDALPRPCRQHSGSSHRLESLCYPHPGKWQAGRGADSQGGGLALQPSPGALGQKGSNRGNTKTLLVAANMTWKVLFLRRRWFIKLCSILVQREDEDGGTGSLAKKVKGPKRLSRSHCPPQAGSRNLAVTTHPHIFLRKACLLQKCIHCICTSSCRAKGATVPEDVAQWYTAFFTTLINVYQEKLQKFFEGGIKAPNI